MNETLSSILFEEEQWSFDEEGRWIKFRKDGTGQISCRCNFNYFIFADIQWKTIKSSNPSQDTGSTWTKTPKVLGQLDVEITLVNQLPQCGESTALLNMKNLNGNNLVDDSFQPKVYSIRIEEGNFKEPCDGSPPNSEQYRYARRLLFDKSPYPPRSEWKRPEGGPDSNQFWDIKEFVGRQSRDLRGKGRAMNDPDAGGWNRCVIV
ncbi:hypothetical protein EV356DRAFT_565140 [Viridothelium virens]|uniref:Uncharacterized protein n=1 Tax=Viridothelium virens TaxID=1048519 RepID=A0A6A6HFZ9_VIRVR|nr:hypothetical protein EV356DRAFT_565140 [Viridothelium virens]